MKLHSLLHRKVPLPTTPEAFDALITRLVARYKLTDAHHAAAIISVAIRHLPNDVDHTTEAYLIANVRKNIANHIAASKASVLQHDAECKQLVDLLKTNPNNMQARDALTAAASDGDKAAIEALKALEEYESTI
jgi:Glu-tRNA(Gln) amidotransferase subunit E-like FAD-binding protein